VGAFYCREGSRLPKAELEVDEHISLSAGAGRSACLGDLTAPHYEGPDSSALRFNASAGALNLARVDDTELNIECHLFYVFCCRDGCCESQHQRCQAELEVVHHVFLIAAEVETADQLYSIAT
jgi:hypothetical protein